MTTNTDVNGWPLPSMTDQPVITTAENTPLVLVDRRVNPIFSTLAARATAITAPDQGMECYVSETKEKYIYDGTRWIGAAWRTHHWENTYTLNNTGVVNDIPDGVFTMEANSVYDVELQLLIQSHVSAGVRWNFSGPTGSTGIYRANLYDQLLLNSTAFYSDRWFGLTGGVGIDRAFNVGDSNEKYLTFHGTCATASTAGTFQFKFGQFTAQVQNLKIFGFTEATPQGVSMLRTLKIR